MMPYSLMIKRQALPAILFVVLLSGLLSAGCTAQEEPPEAESVTGPELETYADTVAMRAYEAFGGPEAWNALPYLRFDFGVARDTVRNVRARHFWDRMSGNYRVEMNAGGDTVYVALFNVNTREGEVYLNGTPLDSTQNAEMLDRAYARFINDTYWLLMPVKLFDPGVRRTYLPDSSNAEVDVIKLGFGEVGLTPDDHYWIYVDKETGRVDQWAYVLQGNPDAPPSYYHWTGYEEFQTPAGPVHLATRKEAQGRPVALLTDNVATPAEAPPGIFTDPQPRL